MRLLCVFTYSWGVDGKESEASSRRVSLGVIDRFVCAREAGVHQATFQSFASLMVSNELEHQQGASRSLGLRRYWVRPCWARRSFWSIWPLLSFLTLPIWLSCCSSASSLVPPLLLVIIAQHLQSNLLSQLPLLQLARSEASGQKLRVDLRNLHPFAH